VKFGQPDNRFSFRFPSPINREPDPVVGSIKQVFWRTVARFYGKTDFQFLENRKAGNLYMDTVFFIPADGSTGKSAGKAVDIVGIDNGGFDACRIQLLCRNTARRNPLSARETPVLKTTVTVVSDLDSVHPATEGNVPMTGVRAIVPFIAETTVIRVTAVSILPSMPVDTT
jgi:hypothetical protein